MRRMLAVSILLMACALNAVPAQSPQPFLLRDLTVTQTRVAFSYLKQDPPPPSPQHPPFPNYHDKRAAESAR